MGQSIDLGGSTFLDSSAVAMNSTGLTLANAIGKRVKVSGNSSVEIDITEGAYLVAGYGWAVLDKYLGVVIGYVNWDADRTKVYDLVPSSVVSLSAGSSGYKLKITNSASVEMYFGITRLIF